MKLSLIFTDTPNLKALRPYDIYRTYFEFPDSVLSQPDYENKFLTIVESIGQLTRAYLHVSCKQLGWHNKKIASLQLPPVDWKESIRENFFISAIGYETVIFPFQFRALRIMRPASPKFTQFQPASRNGKTFRPLKDCLSMPQQVKLDNSEQQNYVQTLDNLARLCLELLAPDLYYDWHYAGINPFWYDKSFVTEFNKRAKIRNKGNRVYIGDAKPPQNKQQNKKANFGQIYFIQQGDNGAIKIGYSTNPEKRLQTLRTASPLPLRILKIIVGGKTKEKDLHRQFAHLQMDGEWFQSTPELLEYIATLPENES